MVITRWTVVLLSSLLVSFVAKAAEPPSSTSTSESVEVQPCRHDGNTVVCTDTGFSKLITSYLDVKKERDETAIRFNTKTAELETVTKALNDCLAEPPLVVPPVVDSSKKSTSFIHSALPFLLGAAGASAVVTAVAVDMKTTPRLITAGVGLGLLGVGVVFVLP